MKKILIIVILIFSSVSYSQDALDIIGKETCECLNKKIPDVTKVPSNELQNELGACMMTSYMAHKSELKPEDQSEFGNSEGMRKLGENVAMKMLVHCPNIIMELGRSSLDEEAKVEEVENAKISGQFIESKSNDFISISIKDNVGRTHSLILLTFFENSNLISENLLKKNQKIEVEYYEQEFYDPKSKDFRYYKVLQGLKKI
jgi:hypothetical protein